MVLSALKYSQAFFYFFLVLLWFKDNFESLKNVNISYIIPLGLLILVTLLRIFLKYRKYKPHFRITSKKVLIAVACLLILAAIFRIPYLFNSWGLIDSDRAISALMGKHIAEGKLPPVYWYGQFRQGSFKEHINAAVFKIFGYSIPIFVLIPLLFFLGFIVIQFILLKDVFSYRFALAVCWFYCLPMGSLDSHVVWDSAAGLPMILFFGSLIIYLTYLVYYKNRENLVATLGFIMGLAFFSHQISIFFILTALLLIVFKFRFHIKKYFDLVLYAVLGCMPMVLSEIFHGFVLTEFMLGGEKAVFSWAKFRRTGNLIVSLFSHEKNVLAYFAVLLLFIGCGALIYFSAKEHKFTPKALFLIFVIVFILVYFASGFSNRYLIRYVSPLYYVIPILLGSAFLLIKAKVRYFLIPVFTLILFGFNNFAIEKQAFSNTINSHRFFKSLVYEMQHTGEKYWLGNYWTAYRLTALSGEDLIVDSYTIKRYYPYWLSYYNLGDNHNYVFQATEAKKYRQDNFKEILETLDIKAQVKEVDDSLLIYAIEGESFPNATNAAVPEEIPQLDLVGSRLARGFIFLNFRNSAKFTNFGFRLQAEIPHYATVIKPIPEDSNQFEIRLPLPAEEHFEVKYSLNYWGLKIPFTDQRAEFFFPEADLHKQRNTGRRIVNLSGFGPYRKINDKSMAMCGKEVKLEIRRPLANKLNIYIHLHSLIDFDHPYWYGNFFQQVSVYLNEDPLVDEMLKLGENIIKIDISGLRTKANDNILTLTFDYILPDPTPFWSVAAFLDKVEIK